MIRSYGVHWRVDRVFWGRQNNPGTLMGAASRSRLARPVDFREQRGIYALYAEYELVYVGQTGAGDDRLFRRLKAHRSDHLSERWDRFSWFGTQWVTQQHLLSVDTAAVHQTVEAALNMLEAVAVAIAETKTESPAGSLAEFDAVLPKVGRRGRRSGIVPPNQPLQPTSGGWFGLLRVTAPSARG